LYTAPLGSVFQSPLAAGSLFAPFRRAILLHQLDQTGDDHALDHQPAIGWIAEPPGVTTQQTTLIDLGEPFPAGVIRLLLNLLVGVRNTAFKENAVINGVPITIDAIKRLR